MSSVLTTWVVFAIVAVSASRLGLLCPMIGLPLITGYLAVGSIAGECSAVQRSTVVARGGAGADAAAVTVEWYVVQSPLHANKSSQGPSHP